MAGVRLRHPMVVSPAPSVTDRQLEQVRAGLTEPGSGSEMLDPVTGRVIELWDPAALRARRLTRMRATAAQSSVEAPSRYANISFETLQPPLRRASGGYDQRRWAVVVRMRDDRVHSDLAEVFPPDLQSVSDLLQRTDVRQPVTATSEGLVVRREAYGAREWWVAPTGTDMFIHWMSTLGIAARLSPAGRAAGEFIGTLGGPLVAIHVGDPRLVRLIAGAAEDATGARVISFSDLQGTLGRIHNNHKLAMKQHAGFLTRTALQDHMRASCPTCEQANWYPPEDLANELRCRRCRRTFFSDRAAAGPPGLGLPGRSDRLPLAATLTAPTPSRSLRFFLLRGMTGDAHSWTVSLEATTAGSAFEVDFGVWLRPGATKEELPALVFGEAKTFNRFESSDFARAETVLRQFPQAHMVFATLRDSLTRQERRALTALARRGGREANRGRMIFLTATELCDRTGFAVPFSWKDLSGPHADLADRYSRAQFDLGALSDATLELYAGWRWPAASPGVGASTR